MNKVTIYHNPRCSKSREALALLQSRGVEPEIRDYLNDAPTEQELSSLHGLLHIPAHEMLRVKEDEYLVAGLNKESSAEAIYKAISAYPKLLERPVVVCGEKAVIARPPDKLLVIIE